MAFEDRYFKSTNYGVLNLRFRPTDQSKLPVAAISDAANTPGRFCLAKVTCKQSHHVKICYSAQKFSEIRPTILSELRISLAGLRRDVERSVVRGGDMKVTDTVEAACKDSPEDSLTLLLTAQRECMEVRDAIHFWNYEEGLCTQVALANCLP